MAHATVGLVLRRSVVEIVEARRHPFKGLQLSKVVSVPILPGGDGQVAEAIRTALSNAGIGPMRLGVSISSPEVFFRSFTMPLLPKAEWDTAVRFEARKYIPFKTDDLKWNYHVTEQRSTRRMTVAFIGIPAQTFARIQGSLASAGVTPAFIEAQSVSLARLAAEASKTAVPGFIGLVNVDTDANLAHIVVAKECVPYFAREAYLHVDQHEVDQGPTATDLRAKVLLSELRLSLDFFTREHPTPAIKRLLLFGEPGVVAPWVGWLAEQLRLPVELGGLPLGDEQGHAVGPQLATGVGLVLRETRLPHVKLEFLDHAAIKAPASARITLQSLTEALNHGLSPQAITAVVKATAIQAGFVAALIASLSMLGDQRVAAARRDFERAVQSFPDVGFGLAEQSRAELEALREQVERHQSLLRKTIEGYLPVTGKLNALAMRLPGGVWLEGLSYRDEPDGADGDRALTLMGSCFLPGANELEAISQFAERLQQDRAFFQGFRVARVGEIATRHLGSAQSYRTFTLSYDSKERQ